MDGSRSGAPAARGAGIPAGCGKLALFWMDMTQVNDARDRPDGGAAGLPDPAPLPRPLEARPGHGHVVQFYDATDFLAAVVGEHLAAGLAAGEPLLVIATPPHRAALARHLAAAGFDVDDARRRGHLTMLDARETLSTFMEGALPDARRFRGTVGRVLEQRLEGGRHATVRAFGEMVDVLWKDGNPEGAVRLEALWNELARTHPFSLLCAYDMANFARAADAAHFEAICGHHAQVLPTERWTTGDDDARLREIALLQQRARALEAEVEQRRALERELRDALTERDALLARAEAARAEAEQARTEAEVASRAKSQFLAVMSHELRTPLNAIGGHVQLMELGIHGPLTDAQRDALVRVQRSQRHLLALINDVLNLARVESGHVEYALADVALAPLLADVVATVAPLLAAKGLACETAPGADEEAAAGGAAAAPLVARADQEKVQQILLNLLTNAVKFTPAGGRVTVTAARLDGAGAGAPVCVRVADTGVGIPAPKLQSIFEPFVQVDRGHAPDEGVGLGLSISRHLARGMGGDLTVASIPGAGSVFTLTLPGPA